MAFRQDYPTSDPTEGLARTIDDLRSSGQQNGRSIAAGALPEPLIWRITPIVPGPPPTFMVEIVNPLTGGAINLGTI